MRWLRSLYLFPLFFWFSGCADDGITTGSEADPRLPVVATIAQIGDVLEHVAGEVAAVEVLCGPGVDPHLYKASQSDIGKLASSQMIFYNGLMLEGRMVEIFEKIAQSGKPTIAVADALDASRLLQPQNFAGHYDPHIWMDVSLWADTIPLVVEKLSERLPERKDQFHRNGDDYRQELLALHEEIREQIASIPQERRVLVTAHDAFGYFGRAYEIEVLGLQGISTSSEYGLQDLQRLTEVIVSRGVKAVFVESSVPARSIEALVAGCRERGHEVRIGGELYSDAMGAPGTVAGTYVGMIRHNVSTIVNALR